LSSDPRGQGFVYNRDVKRAFAFFFFLSLAAGQLRIDHVIACGTDSKIMQAKLKEANIPIEFGGRHTNHATEMSLVSFPDGSFLELLAIQPDADPKAVAAYVWARQLQGNSGPCGWSERAADVDAEIGRLRAAGVQVGKGERGDRDRTDGKKISWEAYQLGPEPRGSYFPYLQRDLTPRELRAFPRGKPTTEDFNGVAAVVIAVRDLEEGIRRFRQAYAPTATPLRQDDPAFGARLAKLGDLPLILAAPLNAQSWLNGRIKQFGEGPCAFLLSARRSGRQGVSSASKARWFGTDISWVDPDKLGWRLGIE
jgi:hypothetical protein